MGSFFNDLKSLKILFSREDRRGYVLLLSVVVFGAVLESLGVMAVPLFVTALIDPARLNEIGWVSKIFGAIPVTPDFHVFLWSSVVLISFVVAKNAFLVFMFFVQATLIRDQSIRLRDKVFRAYQSAPYDWLIQKNTSELFRNLQNDCTQMLNGVIVPCLDLLMSLAMIVFVLVAMFLSSSIVTIASVMVVGIGSMAIVLICKKALVSAGEVSRVEFSGIHKAVQQAFGAVIDARIAGCESHLADLHVNSIKRLTMAERLTATISKSTPYAIETISTIGLVVVLVIIIGGSESLVAAVPVLSLVVFATIRIKQMMTKMASSINRINASRPNIKDVVNDFTLLHKSTVKKTRKTRAIGEFQKLVLSNVTYQYPESDRPALNEVSFEMKAGQSVGIVGSTGCGKSTLVNVILGLLVPSSGIVEVNDGSIEDDIDGWRANLSYVPQSVYLLDDTVAANVGFGVLKEELDYERVWECLKLAKLDDFVKELPNQLDTTIGERGVRMSGGQRQRLGIARALFKRPKVLVLDEATSALDNQTEREIISNLTKVQDVRSWIMIAHRLSTVERCDKIIVVNKGNIENEGSYDQLVATSAYFRSLVNNVDR